MSTSPTATGAASGSATVYEMPASATAPRSRTMDLTPDEARVVELHREMLAQRRDADGSRVRSLALVYMGERVELRVERAY